jgi:hypothetical protein
MGFIIPSRPGTKITLNLAADGSYTIPTNLVIDLIEVKPTANLAAVTIGTTPGGEEISPAVPASVAGPNLTGTLLKGPVTIYFGGITALTQIIFYRKS